MRESLAPGTKAILYEDGAETLVEILRDRSTEDFEDYQIRILEIVQGSRLWAESMISVGEEITIAKSRGVCGIWELTPQK